VHRLVAPLILVAAVGGACTGQGAGPVDCTGGYATAGGCVLASRITAEQVAHQVASRPLPLPEAPRLADVVCTVSRDHRRATCSGTLPGRGGHPDRRVRAAFRITSEGTAIPDCRRAGAFCRR
jgi:hypothetical protein